MLPRFFSVMFSKQHIKQNMSRYTFDLEWTPYIWWMADMHNSHYKTYKLRRREAAFAHSAKDYDEKGQKVL